MFELAVHYGRQMGRRMYTSEAGAAAGGLVWAATWIEFADGTRPVLKEVDGPGPGVRMWEPVGGTERDAGDVFVLVREWPLHA